MSITSSLIETFQRLAFTTEGDRQGILCGRTTAEETVVLSSSAVAEFRLKEMCISMADAHDPIIGYYRIREGDSLELTASEVELGSTLFAEPGFVILLIERRRGCPAAKFFCLSHGESPNLPLLEFPLDPAALSQRQAPGEIAASEKAVVLATPVPLPPVSVSSTPAPSIPVEAGPGRWRMSRVSILAVLMAVALASLSAALFINRPRNPVVKESAGGKPLPEAGKPLRVERQGDDLKIMWDLNSPAVSDATAGVLDIDDGGIKRQIPMTTGQVRFGSVLYSPVSAQISVQMTTLKASERTSQGSVMVLLNKPPQPQTGGDHEKPEIPFEVKSEQPMPMPARAFVPPAVKSETKAPVITAEPPAIQANPERFAMPPLPGVLVAPPAPLASPESVPAKPVEEAKRVESPAALPTVTTPRNEKAEPRIEDYVAPVLVSQSGLRIPPELPRILAPVAIRVRVDVNQAGQVTHADAIPEKGVHALLLQAATDAAKKCRFQPARRGQSAVSSTVTIVFHVGGQGAAK